MLNHARITKFKICPIIIVEYDMVDSGTALRNYFNNTFIMHIHLLLLLWCFSPFLDHGLPNLLPSLLFSKASVEVSKHIQVLQGGVVNPTPKPQPGGPGYPFLSGSSV
jgi:hypothetical protein